MSQVLIFEQPNSSVPIQVAEFSRAGLTTHFARSIFEFKGFLKQGDPQLVCFDADTLSGNGYAAVSRWRRNNPHKPIIVTTEHDDLKGRRLAERINAAAFLPKPYSLRRFVELVQRLVKQSITGWIDSQSGPSVMMYSHDTIGLGHMRRNSAIAANITTELKDASVLMLVGSPTGAFFDLGPGVDFIKLPSLVKVGRDQWQPGSLRVPPSKARDVRASLIFNSVETFKPDVFLVDHEPAGVWDELVPVLRKFRTMSSPPRVVLGLRDILDEPAKTLAMWKRRGILQLISDCYDDILVYGNEQFFPTSRHYDLERIKPGRIHYCGLVSSVEKPAPSQTRRSGIIVAGGGGRDAAPMFNAVLNAVSSISPKNRPKMTLISGPLMDEDIRADIHARSISLGLDFHASVTDLADRLFGAELFLTMGGYNSLTEAIATGVPTVVIPRVGPSSEQRLRAERLAEMDLARILPITQASPEKLAAILQNAGSCGARTHHSLSLDGAKRAAELIVSTCLAQSKTRPLPSRKAVING